MSKLRLPEPEETVRRGQVAAFRLARHHLAERGPADALSQVAGDVAGVHAQVMSAAQLSLWSRTRGLRLDDVNRALWQDRTLVKGWWLRGALHLIPSDDFALFVRGCARRTARWARWMTRAGIPMDAVERMIEAIRQALDRPLTRKELVSRMSDSLGAVTKRRGGRGWGGPSDAAGFEVEDVVLSIDGIISFACLRGIACFGPVRGNDATFVRPDRWLPGWRELEVEAAEDELLRRYLRAFGPATVTDFAQWTYMTAADAREIWGRLKSEFAPVMVGRRTSWLLRADLSALRRAKIDGPVVRLLPYFDAFLLGHKDKGHLVDSAHYKRVYRAQGWISPVVLVDGRAAGVWSHARKGRRLAVGIEAFGAFPSAIRSRIEDEAEDLRRFLDVPGVAVKFT